MNKQELSYILNKYGIHAQKSKGQHFLLDQHVVEKIVKAADLAKTDVVVEVGPGLGVLTTALAEVAGTVITVELDKRMLALLERLKTVTPHLQVINQDILTTDFAQLTNSQPFILVGNLPYNITSAIFKHALESAHQPERMVVMVQREVGERIMAGPGEMSLLSISVQLYGKPSKVWMVSRTAFHPQPQVVSMVMKIDSIQQPTDVNVSTLFRLAHMAFNGKRKQLHNTLQAGLHWENAQVLNLLRTAKIPPTIRPQDLSIENWKSLANAFDHLKET